MYYLKDSSCFRFLSIRLEHHNYMKCYLGVKAKTWTYNTVGNVLVELYSLYFKKTHLES